MHHAIVTTASAKAVGSNATVESTTPLDIVANKSPRLRTSQQTSVSDSGNQSPPATTTRTRLKSTSGSKLLTGSNSDCNFIKRLSWTMPSHNAKTGQDNQEGTSARPNTPTPTPSSPVQSRQSHTEESKVELCTGVSKLVEAGAPKSPLVFDEGEIVIAVEPKNKGKKRKNVVHKLVNMLKGRQMASHAGRTTSVS